MSRISLRELIGHIAAQTAITNEHDTTHAETTVSNWTVDVERITRHYWTLSSSSSRRNRWSVVGSGRQLTAISSAPTLQTVNRWRRSRQRHNWLSVRGRDDCELHATVMFSSSLIAALSWRGEHELQQINFCTQTWHCTLITHRLLHVI